MATACDLADGIDEGRGIVALSDVALGPALDGLRRELDTYLRFYNYDRVHHGRLTRGQIPADIVYGARKMELR